MFEDDLNNMPEVEIENDVIFSYMIIRVRGKPNANGLSSNKIIECHCQWINN